MPNHFRYRIEVTTYQMQNPENLTYVKASESEDQAHIAQAFFEPDSLVCANPYIQVGCVQEIVNLKASDVRERLLLDYGIATTMKEACKRVFTVENPKNYEHGCKIKVRVIKIPHEGTLFGFNYNGYFYSIEHSKKGVFVNLYKPEEDTPFDEMYSPTISYAHSWAKSEIDKKILGLKLIKVGNI